VQVAGCLLDVDNIPENLAGLAPLEYVLLLQGLLQDALLATRVAVTRVPVCVANTAMDGLLNLLWSLLVHRSSLRAIQAATCLLHWLEELVRDPDEALGRRD